MAAQTPKDPSAARAHALELVLTGEDDAAVRARWQVLEDAGVPSLARHRGATHRPHVTLASSPRPPGERVTSLARGWGALLPAALRVSGLVLLGSRRITVAELLEVPDALRAARAELTAAWDDADDRPWLPHLTLATRLEPPDALRAVEALGEPAPRALARSCAALRWWDPDTETVSILAPAG